MILSSVFTLNGYNCYLLFGEQFYRDVAHRGMDDSLFREFLGSFGALSTNENQISVKNYTSTTSTTATTNRKNRQSVTTRGYIWRKEWKCWNISWCPQMFAHATVGSMRERQSKLLGGIVQIRSWMKKKGHSKSSSKLEWPMHNARTSSCATKISSYR